MEAILLRIAGGSCWWWLRAVDGGRWRLRADAGSCVTLSGARVSFHAVLSRGVGGEGVEVDVPAMPATAWRYEEGILLRQSFVDTNVRVGAGVAVAVANAVAVVASAFSQQQPRERSQLKLKYSHL